jgi:Amt family ammonium transporter
VFAADGATPETNATAISTIWVLLSAFLVFLMHAGFTMVETGFTQAKNSVNIIMKNFMTVSIGILMYYFVGYAFMFGNDASGIMGISGFLLGGVGSEAAGLPTYAFFFFQAVFAATCATIVSGAMAERTKFITYLVFTILICGFTYPMIGHWIWSADGWLAKLGFIDFAGSTVVHAVGGFSALIGAFLVGRGLASMQGRNSNIIRPTAFRWAHWACCCCGSAGSASTAAPHSTARRTPSPESR